MLSFAGTEQGTATAPLQGLSELPSQRHGQVFWHDALLEGRSRGGSFHGFTPAAQHTNSSLRAEKSGFALQEPSPGTGWLPSGAAELGSCLGKSSWGSKRFLMLPVSLRCVSPSGPGDKRWLLCTPSLLDGAEAALSTLWREGGHVCSCLAGQVPDGN